MSYNNIRNMAKMSREERKTMMYVKQIEEMEKDQQKKQIRQDRGPGSVKIFPNDFYIAWLCYWSNFSPEPILNSSVLA